MIKLLYPEVKPHHWIGLSILVGICACMRDWGVPEVSESGALLTAGLIYGGLKVAGKVGDWVAQKRQTKDQREAYAKGAAMLKKGYKPKGLGQAGKEGILASGMQGLQASTRGLEAETRRASQSKVGGSELATRAILAKQKAEVIPKIQAGVTAADIASKQQQYGQWAGRAGALMGTGPAPVIGSPVGAIAEGAAAGMSQYAAGKAQQTQDQLSKAYLQMKGADVSEVKLPD